MNKSYTGSLRARRTLIYICFGILTLLSLLPFAIMLADSTRSVVQLNTGVSLLPGSSLGHNIKVLLSYDFNLGHGMFNSAFIAVVSTALSVYCSALAAYALVAYDFKAKRLVYAFVIALIMIPGQVSMVGFYQFMIQLNLLIIIFP